MPTETMTTITYHEYWSEVTALGDAVAQELQSRHPASYDAHDELIAAVDGHQWIIYGRYHAAVMGHTANEESLIDDLGPTAALTNAGSWADVAARFAQWSFLTDVTESYWNRFDESGERLADCGTRYAADITTEEVPS